MRASCDQGGGAAYRTRRSSALDDHEDNLNTATKASKLYPFDGGVVGLATLPPRRGVITVDPCRAISPSSGDR